MSMIVTEKNIRKNWFAKHQVIHHEIIGSDLGRLEYLRWQEPGTSVFWVDYILKNATLFVSGDIGEAVYIWSQPFSLLGISQCSLDYFHGKCTASEWGRTCECYEWDSATAKKTIKEHFEEYSTLEKYEIFKQSHAPLDNKNEFIAWCYYNNIKDIFDDNDFWEWGYNCGDIIPGRIKGHLIGLRMAFENV